MKCAYALLLVIAISAIIITAVPVSAEIAETEGEAFFEDIDGIHVEFPYGRISYHGVLVFTATSDKYDLYASSIWFFGMGSDNKPDYSDNLIYIEHRKSEPGRMVAYEVHNIRTDFEIAFADMKLITTALPTGSNPYENPNPDDDSNSGSGTTPGGPIYNYTEPRAIDPTQLVMSLAVVFAAALLIFSVYNLRILDAALRKAGEKAK
jgi:hypothetical protein